MEINEPHEVAEVVTRDSRLFLFGMTAELSQLPWRLCVSLVLKFLPLRSVTCWTKVSMIFADISIASTVKFVKRQRACVSRLFCE